MSIQYNLNSMFLDSTFYWLVRHFLLEHNIFCYLNHLVREIG